MSTFLLSHEKNGKGVHFARKHHLLLDSVQYKSTFSNHIARCTIIYILLHVPITTSRWYYMAAKNNGSRSLWQEPSINRSWAHYFWAGFCFSFTIIWRMKMGLYVYSFGVNSQYITILVETSSQSRCMENDHLPVYVLALEKRRIITDQLL
jgi:hypothetical protein